MLLSIVSGSDEKSTAPLVGLRSLLVPDAAVPRGAPVVTRTIPASRGGEITIVDAREEAIDVEAESGRDEDNDDDTCCWVPCGRRGGRRRRLPPPIPSLSSRCALRRARTEDRPSRLVITKARVMRPDYYVVRARRRGGRLVMRLVQRQDDDDAEVAASKEDDEYTATTAAMAAEEERDGDALPTSMTEEDGVCDDDARAAAALPAVGCFGDVVRYHHQCSIGSSPSPLHQMPLLRMVH